MQIAEDERVTFVRHDLFTKEWEAVGKILIKGFLDTNYFAVMFSCNMFYLTLSMKMIYFTVFCIISGEIITAFCRCTAGVCHCCNHVVAVLYKIEYANKEGLTEQTCTEKICVWNSSSKQIAPMKIKVMHIMEHNKRNGKEKTFFINNKDKRNFVPRPEICKMLHNPPKNHFYRNF